MHRREFLQLLSAAAAAGLPLAHGAALAQPAAERLYEVPAFGNVHLLHFTDCHAQLKPTYFREPDVNLGLAAARGQPPHLVGEHLLRAFHIAPGSIEAHAFTYLDFVEAAKIYGKVGGFAHLATLVKRIKASRPGALLLDGGDTWQGSGPALWTRGQDMVDAAKLLGVDVMTGHWEFTLGIERVKEIVERELAGKIEFLAQNIKTADFGDPVFPGYTIRQLNGVPVAIIGQAFPYTPIANPRYFVADWTFGIQEEALQKVIDEVRAKGARVVVLLSHNGMDVDLKLAGRVRGLTAILGGHTHDGVPAPTIVTNGGGRTLVTNAGCNGKFLAVLDLEVKSGGVDRFSLQAVAGVFQSAAGRSGDGGADREVARAVRGQAIGKTRGGRSAALPARQFQRHARPGDSRWPDGSQGCGDRVLARIPLGHFDPPGQAITMEHLLDQTAITYPYTTVTMMSAATIKTVLEDVADNLFNPDPYYQQGGDMVRVGGLQYTCDPTAKMGARIVDMSLNGKPLDASRQYKVAGWAPVSEEARAAGGEPIWDLMAGYLKAQKVVRPKALNLPRLRGVDGNPGIG